MNYIAGATLVITTGESLLPTILTSKGLST